MWKRNLLKRIRIYAKANYTKLDKSKFVQGDLSYNYRCHLNSVQKVKENKAAKVISCFCIGSPDGVDCIHFINQLADGTFQDNTWGWMYKNADYYEIKEVSPDEQESIWNYFSDLRDMLVDINGTTFQKFMFIMTGANCI